MDTRKVHHWRNPKLNANFFSKLFFCWIFPYVSYGSKNELESKDVFELAPQNQSEILGDKLEKCWNAEVQEAQRTQRRPSFLKAIVKTFGRYYFKCTIIAVAATFSPMMVPAVIKLLISHFYESSNSTVLEACSYVLLLMLTLSFDSILYTHVQYLMYYIGGQVKIACSSVIYKKLLRLRIDSQDRSDGGRIITLLSNDVAQFDGAFNHLHRILLFPIEILTNIILIWRICGITSIFVVLTVLLQNVPMQVFFAFMMKKLREKTAQMTDRRLLLLDEIINGIRVIKMYTWEKPLEKLILLARRKEMDFKIKKLYFDIVLKTFLRCAVCETLYITIAILIGFKEKITSLIIFPLIHYNFDLNIQTGHAFPRCISSLAYVPAAAKRIQDFLLLEEVKPIQKFRDSTSNNIITVENVSISRSQKDQALQKFRIAIVRNKLYALVGEIGTGKSSLLKVILGELQSISGQVSNYGDISFANQEPWIFNGSIRSNILLGESFDEEKYNKVISCCALLKDFEQLPHGDKTVVGERGAALSGGQNTRINLARAVYRNADIYLLDDPLSSIDYYVGRCIFEKCISGLLKDKTRILVTQKLEYIEKADEIILVKNGQIEYQGDYTNFRKTDFFQYLSKNVEVDATSSGSESSFVHVNHFQTDEVLEPKETEELLSDYKESERLQSYRDPEENIEQIKRGKIPFSLLKEFYNNNVLVICNVILLIMGFIFISTFDYLVLIWVQNQDEYFTRLNSTISNPLNKKLNFSESQIKFFYIIGSIVAVILISSIINILLFIKLHRHSCERLHNNMIAGLINSAVDFFDNNDAGRTLNRFSEDLGTVDEKLPVTLAEFAMVTLSILFTSLQVTIASPYASVPLTISLFLAYRVFIFFSNSIWSTKRLEARAKTLVLSHSSATFHGLMTIRSSVSQKMLQKKFNTLQDNCMAAYFTNIDVFMAYYFWTDIVLKFVTVFVGFSFVFLKFSGLTSAVVGYVMFQIFILNRKITYETDCSSKFDLSMVSTERTLEYTKLENENCMEEDYLTKDPSIWPSDGRIKFDNLSLKYSNAIEPALKNINFVIEPKMKVGIIGRTGAGKSSLVTALFHLAKIEGSLIIDGINTKTISLKYLRSKISVLPQKSILFSTSLRRNLDPFELFDDAQIWSALKCANLDNTFHSLDEELDQKSISSGQRQLLCLARVMLKKNKILILDEASATMDARTEELISNAIKENFKDSTVLTIAHKLNSVIDSDKILVIDEGRIMEYDEPQVLLQLNDSYFSKMYHALHR